MAAAHAHVLRDEPRLEGGEEQARRDAAKEAAEHEHAVAAPVLRDARRRVRDDVRERRFLAAAAQRGAELTSTRA
jgi:hypothetical protein